MSLRTENIFDPNKITITDVLPRALEAVTLSARELLSLGVAAIVAAEQARLAGDQIAVWNYLALAEKCDRCAEAAQEQDQD